MSPLKILLIDAIKGRGTPNDMSICDNLEKVGRVVFTGNQHNPAWSWNMDYINGLSLEELDELYAFLLETQHERCQ